MQAGGVLEGGNAGRKSISRVYRLVMVVLW